MRRRKPISTPAPAGAGSFPVYLELDVGGGSKRGLVQALEDDGCYIGPCAREMIARASFATADSPRTLRLARAQLRNLGFTDWVAWSDVLKAAAKAGAEKLPAEVATRLWLELPAQQPGDHFWILMDPITGQDGEPYVFYLVCHDDGERRLLGRYVSPGRRFFPHREIVFGLRE
ncbi:MAG TPA: hypothetical protein VGI22_26830 [Xanthobacteraceae bacterium]|jgi:hypothetical protein